MSQTRSNFQFVPDKQDPLILTKAPDLVCYGFKNNQLNQRTKGWLVLHVALLTGSASQLQVAEEWHCCRSRLTIHEWQDAWPGNLSIVIPVDGRNLAPVDRYSSLFPFVYMVCFIHCCSSTNSDLPFIHVISWLVTI